MFLSLSDTANSSERIQTKRYTKNIEQTNLTDGKYNLASKTNDIERLLFGDSNAKIEFLFLPSFDGAFGLRIYRDSLDKTNLLETKRIINWNEVNERMNKNIRPAEVKTLTLAQWEEQKKQMEERRIRLREECLKSYKIANRITIISDTLADLLYAEVKYAIGKIKKEVKTESRNPSENIVEIITDGEEAVFRCVVGKELWTLKYHVPEGEYKALSDLFRAMIADVEAGTFDETKYLEALN